MPVAGIELQWFAPISPYLIAAVGCLVVIGARRAWRDYCHRLYAKICHDACKSDRRLRIEENGIVATESGVASSIAWTAISNISVDKDWLTICFSQGIPFCLPKAAFENQEVDGFCAELVRRWNRAKAGSAAEVIA